MLRNGHVVRIAPGTYTAKPDHIDAATPWRPGFEDAAMAYATAQYGDRVPVLFGIGAARFHHAIPRAIGVTVIAVPEQHRPVELADGGRVVFTRRDVERLDARLEDGRLGPYLVTTPEQTLIDLVHRPALGDMRHEAIAAVRTLAARVDRDRITQIVSDYPATVRRRVAEVLA